MQQNFLIEIALPLHFYLIASRAICTIRVIVRSYHRHRIPVHCHNVTEGFRIIGVMVVPREIVHGTRSRAEPVHTEARQFWTPVLAATATVQ